MITLTEQAGSKVKEMMAEEGQDLYLRVGVKPGG
jgi:Fe-S cluster assembly iron-binding protein IscA